MKKILICATSIILFIELLDTTILYSCFVPIANDFGTNVSSMSLPVLSYIVGTCIFIPTVSWLSNQYNKINIITISLFAFSIFSLLCGISPDLYTFSVFRFLQGIAISIAGAMSIVTLLSICKEQDIIKMMGVINIPALLGTAIGPFVGAIFSYYYSWRIAFFINFPLCIVIALSLIKLKSNPIFYLKPNLSNTRLDWLGLGLISLFLIMTSIGFEKLSNAINVSNLLLILSGIMLCLIYVIIWKMRQNSSSKNNDSILDLNVFQNKDFVYGVIINVIARASMCGIPILLAVILQQLYEFSIIKAGFYLAVIASAGIIAKFLSFYIEILGVRRTIIFSSTLTSISILFLSFHAFWISNGYLWIPCFLLGFAMSLLYTSMNSVMYLTLKKNEMSNACNIGSIIQQFGIGLGVVIAVGGFHLLTSLHQNSLSVRMIQTNAFQETCYLLATLMVLNLIVTTSFSAFCRFNISTEKKVELDLRQE